MDIVSLHLYNVIYDWNNIWENANDCFITAINHDLHLYYMDIFLKVETLRKNWKGQHLLERHRSTTIFAA